MRKDKHQCLDYIPRAHGAVLQGCIFGCVAAVLELLDHLQCAIIGAALQVEAWQDRLWRVLEVLTDPAAYTSSLGAATTMKPYRREDTLIALAHTIGGLEPPPPVTIFCMRFSGFKIRIPSSLGGLG